MDLKLIKQIVELMKSSDLTEFEIEEEGLKIRICRSNGDTPQFVTTVTPPPFPVTSQTWSHETAPLPEPAASPAEDKNITFVKSPMVGTFYRAPSPDSPPFIEVGSEVNPETPVCIVEAMKVMNEIQAETKGTIVEVLVENGESVEYGRALLKVKRA